MRRADILLLLGTAICWGSSFLLIKVAVGELDPMLVMVMRCLLGAVLLWMVAAHRRRRIGGRLLDEVARQARDRPWSLLVLGLLTGLPLWLVAAGEVYVDSGLAGIINASVPLWASLLALRFDQGHATTPLRLVGVGIGFLGVVLLTVTRGTIGGASEVWGIALIATASAMYAVSAVLVRERLSGMQSIETAAWSVTIGALLFLPVALIRMPTALPARNTIVAIALLGIVGTFGGFLGYYELLARVGAARASMVTYLLPPLALAYGWVLLDEQIATASIAAMLVIFAGVWIGTRGRPSELSTGESFVTSDRPVLPSP